MAKTLIALVVVLLVALGLQVVGVPSVPITKTISIASHDGYRFGLWGYCDSNSDYCSTATVGSSFGDSDLPSESMRVLTPLLVVHVVAALCTLIVLIMALFGFCGNRKYILALSLLAVLSFLVSLLAFLIEILLFTRHLDFAGWFVLASVVLNGIAIVLLCLQHRHLGDKRKGSSESSEGDDENLITPANQESVDTTNHSDVFEPHRHVERSFDAPIQELDERPGPTGRGNDRGESNYRGGAYAGAYAGARYGNNSTHGPNGHNGPGSSQNGYSSHNQQSQPSRPSRYGQPPYQQGQSQAPNQLLGDPSCRPPQGPPPSQRGNGAVVATAAMAGAGAGLSTYGTQTGQGPQQRRAAVPSGPSGPLAAPALPAHSSAYSDPRTRPTPLRKDTEFQQRAKPVQREDFDFEGNVPPAGADIPGMEDARSSFGPSVVPIPRVRKIDTAELDDGEETRAGTTPTGTPHMVRAMPRDESHVGIVQYAQPERAVPNFSRQNYSPTDPAAAFREMIPSEPVTHTGVSDSPHKPREENPGHSGQQRHMGEATNTHHQEVVPPQQGPESNRLMERFIQELPPSQDYFDYSSEQDHILPIPHSPEGSDFTSVSQRAEHGGGGNPVRGSTGFAPAQRRAADRNDMVLNTNPDFALPASGRGGRKGRGRGGRH